MRAPLLLLLMSNASCIFLIDRLTKDVTCGNGKSDKGEVCYVIKEPLLEIAPNDLDIADLNSDGRLDIAVASFTPAVSIFLNLGDGLFTERRPLDFTGSNIDFPNDVIFANVQGRTGLLVANAVDENPDPDTGEVVFFESLGNGNFDTGVAAFAGNFLPSHIVSLDADGDNALDVLLSDRDFDSTQVALLRGDTSGPPFFGAPLAVGGLSGPLSVAAGDLDKDGTDDIVVSEQAAFQLQIVFFDQGNIKTTHTEQLDGNGGEPVLADFDNDGNLDIAVGVTLDDGINIESGLTVLIQKDGQGSLFEPRKFEVFLDTQKDERAIFCTTADFDQDGDIDIATLGNQGSLTLSLNDGDGNFAQNVSFEMEKSFVNPDLNGLVFTAVRAGDLNGDTVPDFAVLGTGGVGLEGVMLLLSTL
jgi:hypothetical protein